MNIMRKVEGETLADSEPPARSSGWTKRIVMLSVPMLLIVAGLFFWLVDLGLAWATKALSGQGA